MGHWRNHLELWISSSRALQLRRKQDGYLASWERTNFLSDFWVEFWDIVKPQGVFWLCECVKLITGCSGERPKPGKHRDWGGLEKSKCRRAERRWDKKHKVHVSNWSVLLWGPALCLSIAVCPAFLLTSSCLFSMWRSLFSVWQRYDSVINFKLG